MVTLSFPATIFDTFYDRRPKRTTLTLGSFYDYVTATGTYSPENKRQQKAWSPGLYPEGAQTKVQDQMQGVSALVLDFDDDTPLEQARAQWRSYRHLLHTSYSHMLPDHKTGAILTKCRIILPYARIVTVAEHERIWKWAKARSPNIDPACKDPGRIYGWPVQAPHEDADEPEYIEVQADTLDPDKVLASLPPVEAPKSTYTLLENMLDKAAKAKVFADQGPQEDYEAIKANCGFMQYAEDNAENLSEPEWYGWLSVLTRCVEGEEIAHRVGMQHHGYTQSETEEKFNRAKEYGPRTCNNIEGLSTEAACCCAKCPLKGTITSPVQAGMGGRSVQKAGPFLDATEQTSEKPQQTSGPLRTETPALSTNVNILTASSGAGSQVSVVTHTSTIPSAGLLTFPSAPSDPTDNIAKKKQRLEIATAKVEQARVTRSSLSLDLKKLQDEKSRWRANTPHEDRDALLQKTIETADALRSMTELLRRAEAEQLQAEKALLAAESVHQVPPGADPVAWASLLRGKFGPTASPENANLILRLDPVYAGKIWLDEFALQPYFDQDDTSKVFTDTTDMRIIQDIQRRYDGLVFDEKVVRGAIAIVAEDRKRHPVRDYLGGLVWDGTPRVQDLMTKGFGAAPDQDPSLLRRMGEMFLVGLVIRIYKPGEKADNMLVLAGGQRKYKSTALRTLVSPSCAEQFGGWFMDEPFNTNDKDSKQLLLGKWLIEVGELDSFKGKAQTAIKAWLSKQEDRFRPPYGYRPILQRRQCLFAGTTNEDEFFTDSTGNLRYLAVKVTAADLDWIAENRDQLWAEAVQLYRSGVKHYMTNDEEYARLADQNGRFEVRHPWQEGIESYVRRTKVEVLTIADVLTKILEIPLAQQDPQDKTRVVAILRNLRFSPPGPKEYAWRTPAELLVRTPHLRTVEKATPSVDEDEPVRRLVGR